MNAEIVKQLSVITEEEQRILEGQKNINKNIYTNRKELVVDSQNFLQKGKLIQVRTHTRFVHFPKHRHNYVEVIYMCRGKTTHIIDGNEVVLEEGDLLFLNQNATQEILPAGKDDIAINFIIQPQFFDRAFEMIGADDNLLRDFLVGSLCEDGRRTSYLYFHVADVLPIQNLIENMIWSLLNNQFNKRSCNQLTMGLVFLHLLNHIEKMEAGGRAYRQEFEVSVLNYVETKYKEGSLTELAELMGYSVYWLSHEIKKRTGMTYKELVQTKRMNQAAYMLINSQVSVAEIIRMVGYDNTSYFHRKFKERYGVSPKEFRVQHQ
ncbi:MAG: helix-turn-helix domain-containing protein [Tyzzerella sp.]|nr:helix-turn-helix domain-containing protein [Tyzzerella sp.]